MMKALVLIAIGGFMITVSAARLAFWVFIPAYTMSSSIQLLCFVSLCVGMMMMIFGAHMIDKG